MVFANETPIRDAWEAGRRRLLFTVASVAAVEVTKGFGDSIDFPARAGRPRQIVWLRGSARVETRGGGVVHLRAGTVWTSGASEAVTLIRTSVSASGIEISFPGVGLSRDYAVFIGQHFGPVVELSTDAVTLQRARRLLEEEADAERRSRRIFAWFSALHAALERRRVQLTDLLRAPDELPLEECARHGCSVKSLAAHLGCTPAFLAGRLRRVWREPAGEGLRRLRHRHALRLLADSALPMTEIALRCGFSGAASFCTAFKRVEGMTPMAARASFANPATRKRAVTESIVSSPVLKSEAGRGPWRWDHTPVTVWEPPYFQLDGGEVDWAYESPYELALNGITDAVHWIYTLEGEAVFSVGETDIRVKPGMLIVYPKPLNARWTTPGGRPWRRVWVNARGPWAKEALKELGQAHGWAATLPVSSRPVRLAREWVRYWNEHRSEPSLEVSRSAYEWLLSWWRLLADGRVVKPLPLPDLGKVHSRSFFRQIKSITRYAEQVGYSRSHLSRKLGEQWAGGTPAQIVRRQRLAQAALELRQTRLSIADIARRAQFASSGSFIPAFRREFGTTPLAYRFSHS